MLKDILGNYGNAKMPESDGSSVRTTNIRYETESVASAFPVKSFAAALMGKTITIPTPKGRLNAKSATAAASIPDEISLEAKKRRSFSARLMKEFNNESEPNNSDSSGEEDSVGNITLTSTKSYKTKAEIELAGKNQYLMEPNDNLRESNNVLTDKVDKMESAHNTTIQQLKANALEIPANSKQMAEMKVANSK